MVGAKHLGVDGAAEKGGLEIGVHQDVVQPGTIVGGPSTCDCGPAGISTFVTWIKSSESIHQIPVGQATLCLWCELCLDKRPEPLSTGAIGEARLPTREKA